MPNDLELHRHLIGRQGSRGELNTPALVIERGALERNIAAMAAFAKTNGAALRPHAKTHKSVDIAQAAAGGGRRGLVLRQAGRGGSAGRWRHPDYPDHFARGDAASHRTLARIAQSYRGAQRRRRQSRQRGCVRSLRRKKRRNRCPSSSTSILAFAALACLRRKPLLRSPSRSPRRRRCDLPAFNTIAARSSTSRLTPIAAPRLRSAPAICNP